MSDEPKKYPADTPVTMEMLTDILQNVRADSGRKSPTVEWIYESVKEHIEPPKPQPKDGEIWLCKTDKGHMTAIWRLSGGWAYWSHGVAPLDLKLTPIKRLIPAEGTDD